MTQFLSHILWSWESRKLPLNSLSVWKTFAWLFVSVWAYTDSVFWSYWENCQGEARFDTQQKHIWPFDVV